MKFGQDLEYPLAAMLLHIGEHEAALTMLDDIRHRHDGSRRSPWNEIECGDHYVRAMASWSLLEEAAGVVYDASAEALRFSPRLGTADGFSGFFITGSGWGTLRLAAKQASVEIDYGSLRLTTLTLPAQGAVSDITCSGSVSHHSEESDGVVTIRFAQPVLVTPNTPLAIAFA